MIFLLSLSISLSGQNGRQKADQLAGQYEVDDNGYVTYSQVIEVPGVSADLLYDRALNYFTYRYKDANSVIQTEDKASHTVVAKGLYGEVYVPNLGVSDIMTYHIVRIDTKEGRARVILSLTGYKQYVSGSQYSAGGWSDLQIGDFWPLNRQNLMKNFYGNVFFHSHFKAQETFKALEKVLNEGNTAIEADDDW